MAVRHDKCAAPSLFLPPHPAASQPGAVPGVLPDHDSVTVDRRLAITDGTRSGVKRYEGGVQRGVFRVPDRSQGWSYQRCGEIRWPSCSFASPARWE